jgi:hypothetical protein
MSRSKRSLKKRSSRTRSVKKRSLKKRSSRTRSVKKRSLKKRSSRTRSARKRTNKIKKLILKKGIIKSIILRKTCEINNLNIKDNNGKIYIYHSFDSKKNKFSGRWYNTDLLRIGKFKLDYKKRIFTYTIPEWEQEYPKYKVIKNVPIQIYFNEKGWNQFTKFIN